MKRGIALMDEKYGPDWAKDHSDEFLGDFNIESPTRCVLGILGAEEGGRFDSGYAALKRKWEIDDPAYYGFTIGPHSEGQNWRILQETWKIALNDLITA